jgi:alpha-L-rhamnosidase
MADGLLRARRLRCEHAVDALGVDVASPRLSWTPVSDRRAEAQSGYQIIVSSTPENLTRDVGDKWDSGRVASVTVEGVPYGGAAFASRERAWWKVRLWDRDGTAGEFSAPARFEMALLAPDDWQARWIGAAAGVSAPLLRAEFRLDAVPRRARVYLTGLGYHELRLNGVKVGDNVLDPASTTYDRDPSFPYSDELHPRVLYVVHDVTAHLVDGANAVGLMLGHGWYSVEPGVPGPPAHHAPWGDRPRGLLQLEIELANSEVMRVCTDASWKTSPGPVVYNNYCHGERYDARLQRTGWDQPGFDDSAWPAAVELDPLAGVLRTQPIPPARVVETLTPVAVTRPRDGVAIADFGQNVTGWTKIAVAAAAGTEITLRHGARLGADGELDDSSNMARTWGSYEARQTDGYLTRGEGTETWEPRFTLHGFRCVEVTGSGPFSLERAEARVVHSALDPTGEFECSTELLNQIHSNVRWTFRASFQGFPQDAADRSERGGWLGEPGFLIEDFLYTYDTLRFWAKWLDDLQDAQLSNGRLPLACPLHWRGLGGYDGSCPDWKTTYPLIVWHHYRFYGDSSILERHYDGVRRLVDLMLAQAQAFILTEGVGDHMEPQPDGSCSVHPTRTPVALTSTAWLYASLQLVVKIARVFGDEQRAHRYDRIARIVHRAFNARFFDEAVGRYGSGTQTALAIPLWLGLVPPEHEAAVAQGLLDEIRNDGGRLATGTMGTAALAQVLPDIGAADVMYDIATQTTNPSWGYQIANGATTLWETWGDNPPDGSLNMKVFGSIEKFLYREVAGISLAAPGWKDVLVKPSLTRKLVSARASVTTVRGDVAIDWRAEDDALRVDLEIPATSRADVWLPLGEAADVSVSESGETIWRSGEQVGARPGVGAATRADGHLRLAIGGGSYAFAIT